ncbi:MAG TPA: hypothetical protein VGI39_08890 [Polyangiaceae bacterium]|jgi:hypothetical protein
MSEVLHLRALSEGTCEVHDWDFERVKREFIPLLRARHGNGGLNVCVPCVERMKRDADRARGRTSDTEAPDPWGLAPEGKGTE